MSLFRREGKLNITDTCNTAGFVGLNIADAWLTGQLLAITCWGWREINPVPLVSLYGSNMLIKGALALVIALVLVKLGKRKMLVVLNVCMLVVVAWLSFGLYRSIF